MRIDLRAYLSSLGGKSPARDSGGGSVYDSSAPGREPPPARVGLLLRPLSALGDARAVGLWLPWRARVCRPSDRRAGNAGG